MRLNSICFHVAFQYLKKWGEQLIEIFHCLKLINAIVVQQSFLFVEVQVYH